MIGFEEQPRQGSEAAATERHALEQRELAEDVRPNDKAADLRACVACGRTFAIKAGEVRFAQAHGVPLPRRCRICRPSRRVAVRLGLER